jgi:hypothetical protein
VTASDDDPDDDPGDFLEGEGYIYSFRILSISNDELFSLCQTPEQILQSNSSAVPALSPSSNDIAKLREAIKQHIKTAPPLHMPDVHENPTTWASTSDTMDLIWAEAVAGESRVPLPNLFQSAWIYDLSGQ